MTFLIFACIIFFAWKYRRRPGVQSTQIHGSTKLELTWSIIPFLFMLVMFGWGAQVILCGPAATERRDGDFCHRQTVDVEDPISGRRKEIDELHVPVGQPVKLTMASEDVIHSFSIPAFRVRHDVVPGHYDTLWFTATKPGRYRLYCTEYCGNQHAGMTGWVDVLDQRAYADWAGGGGVQGSLAEQGQKLFRDSAA